VESLYRSALSMEDPDSTDQALTAEMLARFLRNNNRPDEAAVLQDRAKAIRRTAIAGLYPEAVVSSSVLRVGNSVTAPKLLHKVEPTYSEAARAVKLQGSVLLKVVIDVDGRAKNIAVVNGQGFGLDLKAVEAIRQWEFQPGTSNGTPVPVEAQIEVNFRLM